ncbi:formamidopyrimidine-DNA glycosylase domain-containing protein [Colletotrichum graminicola]|uniref:Formamidopyrimidine-DNA glycosylase domain-containing protein n=1 Tax=Colletotrichum graminicola (strain M1.001 / M2 / FGSC 10212) TaxID=645133 RepID=E3QU78_COLGM|nr:formamidopyrimidine-DNA glycosylase domain-containing protein [Colletotrichum graminicola M1.001]EFQ34416.1 formamidopyrimidine-DNA glycosylase domain-containing protein [Colletotrichum graminicola M1.001]WDK08883.1 formamidopyrimidine-DNA glycosylase domain-containing protein [Colletotrichum graminicola]
MPEIAEVARCVHFLRHHLLGKKIAKVSAPDDANVFGKVGTSGPAFEKALKGRKVVSVGSQGKYFWITFDKPPHAVMHLGMTGWIHIKGDKTAYTNYYKKMKAGEADVWPPKYWKFQLETDDNPPVAAAFTDPRRFGRIRLVDCPGADIRKHSPLKENGPDPVVDVDVFTEAYLAGKMRTRHVPVKALLLDQSHISGIGNWVADEVLYQARLHPEQYCDSFDVAEVARLYEAVRYVCQTAVDKLGDSDEFPADWLFNYRWGKGSKGAASALPNGDKIAFVTVGGRTSCYAPARQKKTGQIVPSAKEEPLSGDEEAQPKVILKKKGVGKRQAQARESEDEKPTKKARGGRGPAQAKPGSEIKQEGEDKAGESSPEPPGAPSNRKQRGPRAAQKAKKPPSRSKKIAAKDDTAETQAGDAGSRRRSLRLKK